MGSDIKIRSGSKPGSGVRISSSSRSSGGVSGSFAAAAAAAVGGSGGGALGVHPAALIRTRSDTTLISDG